jgi:hypothetical protein
MLNKLYRRILPAPVREWLRPFVHPGVEIVRLHARRKAAGRVYSGPFAGMVLVPKGHFDLAALLGTYEKEIHPAFLRLRHRTFRRVLDVGSANGYYTVGAALWQPTAKVISWESEQSYHPVIRALAQANSVDHWIEVRGFCDHAELAAYGEDFHDALIKMDIEGYDPAAVPALREATILVEYHDNLVPDCADLLKARFCVTHRATDFVPRARTAADYPIGGAVRQNRLLTSAIAVAIHQGRESRVGRHGWLLLEPLTH